MLLTVRHLRPDKSFSRFFRQRSSKAVSSPPSFADMYVADAEMQEDPSICILRSRVSLVLDAEGRAIPTTSSSARQCQVSRCC